MRKRAQKLMYIIFSLIGEVSLLEAWDGPSVHATSIVFVAIRVLAGQWKPEWRNSCMHMMADLTKSLHHIQFMVLPAVCFSAIMVIGCRFFLYHSCGVSHSI